MSKTQELQRRTFLDKPPVQDNWDATSLINFSTYQTVYNMMSYNQDYNTQPIYELDYNYSDNTDSDNNLSQLAYRSFLKSTPTKLATEASHWGFSSKWGGAYSSQKGLAPWCGQCRQPCVGVPPLRPSG